MRDPDAVGFLDSILIFPISCFLEVGVADLVDGLNLSCGVGGGGEEQAAEKSSLKVIMNDLMELLVAYW